MKKPDCKYFKSTPNKTDSNTDSWGCTIPVENDFEVVSCPIKDDKNCLYEPTGPFSES
jgi:hypothetical protein